MHVCSDDTPEEAIFLSLMQTYEVHRDLHIEA